MKRFLAVLAFSISLALIALVDGINAIELGSVISLAGFSVIALMRGAAASEPEAQEESLMRHVVRHSLDAIVTADDQGRIETFNRSAEALFGYTHAEAVGIEIQKIVAPLDSDPPGSLLVRATDRPTEAVGIQADGSRFPVELSVTAIDIDGEPKLVASLTDIGDRKAYQEELKLQAVRDWLTDLPNRVGLVEAIQREVRTAAARPLALLLLDLDRFKEVNDALGHATGDQLLKEVAKRLKRPLRSTDTLARFGGDEFAILLPDTGEERARHVAWKLIEALREPFYLDGMTLQVDTSLGITLYPEHGEDAETLIQRADVAMYVAKEKRHGLVVYGPEQDLNHIRQLTIRGDLREAIANDDLSLVFQPKVSAQDGRIVGVEALARWDHPLHGSIPTPEFIELAEHTGLIRQLTRWVLGRALAQAAIWRKQGWPLRVSVNLSPRNLLEDNLAEDLERMLAAHSVAPETLTLEITEGVIIEDPERALANVKRLRQLGVGISVDDFGTGYSSLAYLMRLPAIELKIDRSFVVDMDRDTGSALIVRSIIDLAHNLGLSVVAEGVETEATWQTLKSLGCDVGQGYHLGRPLHPDELLRQFQGALLPAPTVFIGPRPGTAPVDQ